MAEKRKYEGWQYIGRIMAPLIYLFCLILLFRPEWISNDIQHRWFVVLVGCVTGTIALIGGYYWEEVDVSGNYLLWTKGVGKLYKTVIKISYDDIMTVYGIDRETKGIYMIVKNRPQWVSFLKESVVDMAGFKKYIGKKSGGKEDLIRAARTKPRCKKSDIEAIRRLP